MPPEHRPVGVVFQDYLLFPHLSALDNVAFGPRCHGRRQGRGPRARPPDWLDRVGPGRARRAPSRRQLSGGQAQRVALARALAARPAAAAARRAAGRAGRPHPAGHPRRPAPPPRRRSRRRPCWSPTTRSTRWCWPTGWSSSRTAGSSRRAPRPRSPAAPAPTTSPAWSASTSTGARRRPHGTARRRYGRHHRRRPHRPGLRRVPARRRRPAPRPPRRQPPQRLARRGRRPGAARRPVRVALTGELPLLADVTTAAVAELDLHPGRTVWASVKATETHAYPA